jgi:hypothetical protein
VQVARFFLKGRLMKKTFVLDVARESWISVPAPFRKACPFPAAQKSVSIDFNGALLWMGKMSVPLKLPQWALASQWAKVRYYSAADTSTPLRLHPAIDELDTHQKKVLSDDWGVGFSLQWLASAFQYKNVEHGFAAVRDLQRKGEATFLPKKKKSGPDKCPDFLAYDHRNRIHVIECKGNQQGPGDFERQFKRGRQQKRNVEFTNESLVAQRLVTAFAFSGSESNWDSTLRVEDPPPEAENVYYRIEAESVQPIARSIDRIVAVRGLVLAGSYDAAANAFPIETQMEVPRRTLFTGQEHFVAEDQEWVGQSYTLLFPLAITMDSGLVVSGCRTRFGVAPAFSNAMTKLKDHSDVVDSFLGETDLQLSLHTEADDGMFETPFEFMKVHEATPASRYASIRNGGTFISDWELLSV